MRPDLPDFGGQLSALTYDHGASRAPSHAGDVRGQAAGGDATRPARAGHGGDASPASRRATPAGSPVVISPPLSVLLKLMDVPSDDLFAELLTKQLGVALRPPAGSIAAGARVISTGDRAPTACTRRSSTARASRATTAPRPVEVVDLLRRVWHTPVGRGLARFAADRRRQRHGPDDRRRHRRPGPLHRQDRHAELRHEPGRLLRTAAATRWSRSRCSSTARRTAGARAARPDGRRDRQVLTARRPIVPRTCVSPTRTRDNRRRGAGADRSEPA